MLSESIGGHGWGRRVPIRAIRVRLLSCAGSQGNRKPRESVLSLGECPWCRRPWCAVRSDSESARQRSQSESAGQRGAVTGRVCPLADHPSHPSESQFQVSCPGLRPSHGSESRQVYPFVDEIVVVQPAPAPGAPPRPDAAAAFAAWADKLTVRVTKYSIQYKLFRTWADKLTVRVHINT